MHFFIMRISVSRFSLTGTFKRPLNAGDASKVHFELVIDRNESWMFVEIDSELSRESDRFNTIIVFREWILGF